MALSKQIIRVHGDYADLVAGAGASELQLYMIGIASDTDEFIFRSDDGFHRCLDSGTTVLSENSIPFINASGKATHDNANLQFNDGTDTLTAKNILIGDSCYIGSASDTDAIQIEADGDVVFSQSITIADGGNITLQEDISFVGATTENKIKFPDNLPVAIDFLEGANSYLSFCTTDNNNYVLFTTPERMGLGRSDVKTLAGIAALEIGTTLNLMTASATGPVILMNNIYYDGAYKRYVTNSSTAIGLSTTDIQFLIGASGAADAAANAVQIVTIANTGSTVGAGYNTLIKIGQWPAPATWKETLHVLHFDQAAISSTNVVQLNTELNLSINAYLDVTDNQWEYYQNWPATLYVQHSNPGTHTFKVAAAGGELGTAISWTTVATLGITGTTLNTLPHETTDVDSFLCTNSGLIKYRTGAELLGDIGASPTAHYHDTHTLQHDGVNSDGGAFPFSTTGDVTFNQNLILSANVATITHSGTTSLTIASTSGTVAIESVTFTGANVTGMGTLGCGEITVADGSGINLYEDLTFLGATTENKILFPDDLAVALSIGEGANIYQSFDSTDGSEAIRFNVKVGIGAIAPAPLYLLHVLAADGVADNTYVAYLGYAETTAGRNNGVWINAGSNASDYNIRCTSLAGAALWSVTGAGLFTISAGNLVLSTGYVDSKAYYYIDGNKFISRDGTNCFLGGVNAGAGNTGTHLVAIGDDAGGGTGGTNTGNDNLMFGYQEGSANTSGEQNVFLGTYTGRTNTTGSYNLFMATNAGLTNLSGGGNVALGFDSLYTNSTGDYNVAIGYHAGRLYTGSADVFIGNLAGAATNATGVENVFIGDHTGFVNTSGKENTFIGSYAGRSYTTGNSAVCIGRYAGNASNANYLVAIGRTAGFSSTGVSNIYIGGSTGYYQGTGTNNTFVGMQAGHGTGAHNASGGVYLGYYAGFYEHTSDRFFVDNQARTNQATARLSSLLYGAFSATVASQFVTINGNLNVKHAINSGTITITAGTYDNLDVSGVNTVFVDTSGGNVIVGGTIGGVDGQVLNVVVHDKTGNTTVENEEGTGNQDFFLHAGADEVLTAEYGGWVFINDGGAHWHDASHAKHV